MPVPSDYKTFAIFEYFGRRAYLRSQRRADLVHRAQREDAL